MMKIRKAFVSTAAAASLILSCLFISTPAQAAQNWPLHPGCAGVPKTSTQYDGIPGPIFNKRMQCFASLAGAGYYGSIDGNMTSAQWHGVAQQLAKGNYYTGPSFGSDDFYVVLALQKWAQANGQYVGGPLDGRWGPNTYRGVAWCLNQIF
jgi:hypothetical protein